MIITDDILHESGDLILPLLLEMQECQQKDPPPPPPLTLPEKKKKEN